MKKVLIITTSLRPHSNSAALAQEFARGAQSTGHQVTIISLHGKQINFCYGCLSCQKTFTCPIDDDVAPILKHMVNADVLVFATPIYYYELSGQLKTLLDRTNPLFPADYVFRDIYLLTTAADSDPSAADQAVNGLNGWISCFGKARLAGTAHGAGVTDENQIAGNTALKEAYALGQQV